MARFYSYNPNAYRRKRVNNYPSNDPASAHNKKKPESIKRIQKRTNVKRNRF